MNTTHQLYIKNMVCQRCILVVKNELELLGLYPAHVDLGEVAFAQEISSMDKARMQERLHPLGFELIDDKRSRIIEQIKNLIIKRVHRSDDALTINLSEYLSEQLHHDYSYLSNLFSEVEGTTIEKYHIAQKIERVKELLVYDELSLSEIAYQLHYSSVAHLSNQFKKVTGLTPSHFKQIRAVKRKPLDEI